MGLDHDRQPDRLPATIDVLPETLDAAADQLEVLVDSGFRRGSDAARAGRQGRPRPARARLYSLAAC